MKAWHLKKYRRKLLANTGINSLTKAHLFDTINMMRFIVLSRTDAEQYTSSKPYGIISITNTDDRGMVPLKNDPNRIRKLRRRFDDLGKPGESIGNAVVPCEPQDATAMLDFVDALLGQVDHIAIHCDSGASRSRGAAVALGLIYGDETDHAKEDHPNPRVIRSILRSHAIRNGDRVIPMPVILRTRKVNITGSIRFRTETYDYCTGMSLETIDRVGIIGSVYRVSSRR